MAVLVWFNNWFVPLTELGMLLALLLGLLAVFVKRTRRPIGNYFVLLSYGIGMNTWITSAMLVLGIWGWGWLLVGLLFAGIGVVPLSLLATLFHREWASFFAVLLNLMLLFTARMIGIAVLSSDEARKNTERAERHAASSHFSHQLEEQDADEDVEGAQQSSE